MFTAKVPWRLGWRAVLPAARVQDGGRLIARQGSVRGIVSKQVLGIVQPLLAAKRRLRVLDSFQARGDCHSQAHRAVQELVGGDAKNFIASHELTPDRVADLCRAGPFVWKERNLAEASRDKECYFGAHAVVPLALIEGEKRVALVYDGNDLQDNPEMGFVRLWAREHLGHAAHVSDIRPEHWGAIEAAAREKGLDFRVPQLLYRLIDLDAFLDAARVPTLADGRLGAFVVEGGGGGPFLTEEAIAALAEAIGNRCVEVELPDMALLQRWSRRLDEMDLQLARAV